jgi:hypothetical protein
MGWLNQQARLYGLIGSGTDPVATRIWPSPQVVPREWRGRCLRRRRGWSWRFQRSRVRASGELALWDRNDRAGAHSHWPNNLVALMTCDLNLKPPRDGAVYARFEEQRQVYASPSPKRLLFLMGLWRGGWLRQRGHTKNPAIGNLRSTMHRLRSMGSLSRNPDGPLRRARSQILFVHTAAASPRLPSKVCR